MNKPSKFYRQRNPRSSEIFEFVEKAVLRYKSHLHISNDGIDSKWYIVSISGDRYIIQPLSTRGLYSSPIIISKDLLLTNFIVVPNY